MLHDIYTLHHRRESNILLLFTKTVWWKTRGKIQKPTHTVCFPFAKSLSHCACSMPFISSSGYTKTKLQTNLEDQSRTETVKYRSSKPFQSGYSRVFVCVDKRLKGTEWRDSFPTNIYIHISKCGQFETCWSIPKELICSLVKLRSVREVHQTKCKWLLTGIHRWSANR